MLWINLIRMVNCIAVLSLPLWQQLLLSLLPSLSLFQWNMSTVTYAFDFSYFLFRLRLSCSRTFVRPFVPWPFNVCLTGGGWLRRRALIKKIWWFVRPSVSSVYQFDGNTGKGVPAANVMFYTTIWTYCVIIQLGLYRRGSDSMQAVNPTTTQTAGAARIKSRKRNTSLGWHSTVGLTMRTLSMMFPCCSYSLSRSVQPPLTAWSYSTKEYRIELLPLVLCGYYLWNCCWIGCVRSIFFSFKIL